MEHPKFNFVLVHYSQETFINADEINAYAMNDFNCDGIEEFSIEETRVDEILGERAYSGGDIPESLLDEVTLAKEKDAEIIYKYFFYQNDYEENTQNFTSFLTQNFPDIKYFKDQKKIEDWNAEWKKFYTPIHVSKRLAVIPEWLKNTESPSAAEEIYIYPGMGFGTGTHETTFLCLKLFDHISIDFLPSMKCLDFGCGSGILGIAAIKTQKLPTTFCDIDKNALDNCVQNLQLNFAGKNLQGTSLIIRDRFQVDQYDLIFANILLHVLLTEKETLLKSLALNGYLIISGILNHQVETILAEYRQLKKIEVLSKGDWSAILLQREI